MGNRNLLVSVLHCGNGFVAIFGTQDYFEHKMRDKFAPSDENHLLIGNYGHSLNLSLLV
ncbi:hypothetical protein KR51_00021790 [Rubidibacter lacunae KORDI 51-2]|uniref:Uncharacterized protein n=1 Tax=Rubidibacter lacunae KORDI 51-2 TaxID=582515 RepID=U5DL41_9CHRO|nr:hypothetical protein KR51_00021790 [Rubidibacter lacunae KORDI 51-2]